MVTESDIRNLHGHLQTSSGGGDLILGIQAPSEEEILADGSYTAYDLNTVDVPLEALGHLFRNLRSEVQRLVDDIAEGRTLQEYDIRAIEQDTSPIQYISADEIPHPSRFEPLFTDTDIGQITTYEENYPEFQSYRLNVNPTITGFKRFTRRQIVEAEEHFRMYSDDGEYSQFEEDLVTLPDNFDCIFYDGELIVLNPNNFESIFDYFETYLVHADEILTTIGESDINIRNYDEFVDSILDDRRALRKMEEIESIGLYDEITQSDVEEVVQTYDLSIDVYDSGDEWEIVIPDLRNKWDVIRLLNDDHLISDLTEDRYQVYGKDRR